MCGTFAGEATSAELEDDKCYHGEGDKERRRICKHEERGESYKDNAWDGEQQATFEAPKQNAASCDVSLERPRQNHEVNVIGHIAANSPGWCLRDLFGLRSPRLNPGG
jgi:hypothetical protein